MGTKLILFIVLLLIGLISFVVYKYSFWAIMQIVFNFIVIFASVRVTLLYLESINKLENNRMELEKFLDELENFGIEKEIIGKLKKIYIKQD